jgi:molybdate transport system substrate-binding protein
MPVSCFGRAIAVAMLLFVLQPVSWACAEGGKVLVFGAASLKNALDDIGRTYLAAKGTQIVASYAASSTLAKQIEQDAPADVFISADLDWMDYLAKRHLIKLETRQNLLGNRIVLVAPVDGGPKGELTLAPGAPLAAALAGGRLAMGDVSAVPAGKYGKAALEKLGLWDGVKDHIAQAESVRAALALVARGEAPLGVVYATDAAAEPGVKIVATFPEASHPPIIYPVALIAGSKNEAAPAFLTYLRSPEAVAAFRKQGFTVLP